MSRSGQLFIAQTQGTQFTLYAVMRGLGIPLSPEQEQFQAFLESHYPPIVGTPFCETNKEQACKLEMDDDCLECPEARRCPKCGTPLEYFSGLERIPDYLYCPKCNDRAYNLDGSFMALLD